MKKEMKQIERKQNRVPVFIFVALLVIVLVVVLILAVRKGGVSVSGADAAQMEGTETAGEEKWQEGVVSYNGSQYRYNTAIKTYLFLGVDKPGPVKPAEDGISGGQSDAMFLLVRDDAAKKLSIIAIHRNTMTAVDVYDSEGNFVRQEEHQICLQHGYGDGMRTSCLRSVDAVSRLFYNLPVNGYLSLRMDGVPALNDAVGGVTVEVLEDLKDESRGVDLKKGETVTLTGDEAYVYLRARDTDEFDSASGRLLRQQQYLTAFLTQAKSTASEAVVKALDEEISDYMVTNIDFVELVTETQGYTYDASGMYRVPGEVSMGPVYEEYHVDDTALYEMILDIFYESVDG